jgi:RHS repeat-associated protein
LTSEKYPSGKVFNYSVDDFGRLQTVADNQRQYLSSVSFNNKGLLESMNLGNGTSEAFDYNDRFQMKTQSLNKGSQVLQKYDYGYGKVDLATGAIDTTKNNGQLGSIDSYIGTTKQSQQRFDYDSIGRLAESREYRSGNNSNLTYKQKFDFDRFGNMYRKAANNGTAGQANPLPMTAIENADISKSTNRFTTNTTYNDAGMVIADNKFRSMNFSYDANGRQVNATNATNSQNATTVYDALGNRVATKINDVWQFVIYDAFGKLVAEYGTQGEGNGGVSYVLQDWQGSVRASVNSNGFIQARFDFTAFGEEISLGVGTRSIEQGYSGDATTRQGYGLTEKDSSGLNHTWFRKQEQRAGRWTSPDPYKGSMNLGNPGSFNRYSYVESQPTNFVDRSGLLRIQQCTTPWVDFGNGRIYGQTTCVTIYDDGGDIGGGGGGGSPLGLALAALSKKACADLFQGVSNAAELLKRIFDGNHPDARIVLGDLGGAKNGDVVAARTRTIFEEGDIYSRNHDAPIGRGEVPIIEVTINSNAGIADYYGRANGDNSYRRTLDLDTNAAITLLHEFGHVLARLFGADATKIVGDAKNTSQSLANSKLVYESCFK